MAERQTIEGGGLTARPPTSNEIAWAAGLFEGEGSCFVRVQRKNRAGEVREYATPVVVISMTDRDVLERFAAVVGTGNVRQIKGPKNATKPVYRWLTAGAKTAIPILEAFSPWLGARRLERANEVLAVARSLRPNGRDVCAKGHVYAEGNLRLVRNGDYIARRCRRCERDRARERLGITPDRHRVKDIA